MPTAGFAGTDTFRYFVWDSHNDSANIATVSIGVRPAPLPAGWAASDIGAARTGWSSFDGATGTWTLAASGADIWNASDEFHFVSQSLVGDGAVIARVASMENTDPWAKAGAMFRDSTATDSPFASVCVTPSNGILFLYRTAQGATAGGSATASGTAPRWVKVARSGNSFSGYYSSDGATWVQLGSAQTIAMSGTAHAGLALTAHNTAMLNTSTFTDVALLSGLTAWKDAWFTPAQRTNAAVSGLLADANGDGFKNLLAYSAGLSPWTQATTANGGIPVATSIGGYLALTFARLKNAPDLSQIVEVSGDLAAWKSGAAFTTQTSVVSLDASREQVTIRDNTPMSAALRRVIRLRVSNP